MGITWTDEAKNEMHQKSDFSLNDCHITMYYTCEPDLSDFYSVTIPSSPPFRVKETTCFVYMLLSTTEPSNTWQKVIVPMSFPRVSYNWCVTGENKQVRIKYSNN